MPKKKPVKRPDQTLELYILEMLQRGLSSPYDLLARGGISIGASHSTLRRLLQEGLVSTKQERSGRKKHLFLLTKSGRQHLSAMREETLAADVPVEFESGLRLAALAVLAGKRNRAVEVLRTLAEQRSPAEASPFRLNPKAETKLYHAMLQHCEYHRRKAELVALQGLIKKLATAPVQPPKRRNPRKTSR